MESMIIEGLGFGAVGFGISAIGAGLGVGLSAFGATQGIARQPEMQSRIFTVFIMGAAMAEALGLLGFVLAFIV